MELNFLSKLEQSEQDVLKRIPALVTILVGTADGHLDEQEAHIGKLSTEFRKQNGEALVQDYFAWVSDEYDALFDTEWAAFKKVAEDERKTYVTQEIERVNDILPKIEKKYAHALVTSWRGLGAAVARASGGLLGHMAVSHEEHDVMGLNMIKLP